MKGFKIIYETYGSLNENKSNNSYLPRSGGNHHAAGYSKEDQDKAGWWNELIGPDKAFDTNKYLLYLSIALVDVMAHLDLDLSIQKLEKLTEKAFR